MPSILPHSRHSVLWVLLLLVGTSASGQEKKPLTYEQIFRNAEPRVVQDLPRITGWADDRHYLEMKRKEGDERPRAYAVDVETGEESVHREMSGFRDIVGKGIDPANPASMNEAGTRLIFLKENDLYFLDTQSRQFKRLTETPGEEKNPTISPDGKLVAFTRDHNLFVIDLESSRETAYSTDGSDVVYNGWASWVYYEEILGRSSRYRAFWWSPDSKRIIFYRFDDTKVPLFTLYNAEGQHGELERARYPKVGDPNPEVRVGFATIGEPGRTRWAGFDPSTDQYFGMPFWTPDGNQALVQWMNRGQDTLKLYSVDPVAGTMREVYMEHQPSWVDWFESVQFVGKKQDFIIKSEKDGWAHLYLQGLDGSQKGRLTSGPWEVTSIQVVNEERGIVYFTAKKENSTRTDLYSAKLNGSDLRRLTFGNYTHAVSVSPKGSYFTTRYSNVSTPTRLAVYRTNGKLVKELGDSRGKSFDEFAIAKTELVRFPSGDGYDLPMVITYPVGFAPGKRYPVIMSVYGGPSSATVADGWRGLRTQWLAQEGVLQVSVDHRGSGHFGKSGVALMHRSLGKWEMHDYIAAVKWLRSQGLADSTKVCITGGSYGGYVTALALTYGSDYFTHGIAEYSVTDWQLYDSHYTERYMDTKAENPEGYAFGSVLTHAGKYKGLLRLVHGTMDDNVHMQNTIQLVDTLEDLGKHFELMLYPGGRHGWGGPKATHLRNEEYRFYYRHLLNREFPEQLFRDTRPQRGF